MIAGLIGTIVTVLLTTLSCMTGTNPHGESIAFQQLWERYSELPDYRAMAVAGRVESNRWVAGLAGALPSTEAAEQRALIECRKKRRTARLSSLCRLYAIGAQRIQDLERAAESAAATERPASPRRRAE